MPVIFNGLVTSNGTPNPYLVSAKINNKDIEDFLGSRFLDNLNYQFSTIMVYHADDSSDTSENVYIAGSAVTFECRYSKLTGIYTIYINEDDQHLYIEKWLYQFKDKHLTMMFPKWEKKDNVYVFEGERSYPSR